MLKSMTFVLAVFLVVLSCTHDPVIPMEPAISFDQQVLPIIISNCTTAGCHSGLAGDEEDLDPYRNYEEVMSIVKPGDAHGSKLYENITALDGEDAMPPGRPLTEEQIRLIYAWIMQGAKNN